MYLNLYNSANLNDLWSIFSLSQVDCSDIPEECKLGRKRQRVINLAFQRNVTKTDRGTGCIPPACRRRYRATFSTELKSLRDKLNDSFFMRLSWIPPLCVSTFQLSASRPSNYLHLDLPTICISTFRLSASRPSSPP
jgi:hypothetical protein